LPLVRGLLTQHATWALLASFEARNPGAAASFSAPFAMQEAAQSWTP